MPRTRIVFLVIVACSVLLIAIAAPWLQHRPGPAVATNVPTPKRARVALTTINASTGSFAGKVIYAGTLPKPESSRSRTRLFSVSGVTDVPNETLLVNTQAGNGIANVFIYLRKPPAGYQAPSIPSTPVNFYVQDSRFIPHGLLVRVGQPVLIRNRDSILQNVQTYPFRSKQFTLSLPPRDLKGVEMSYNKPEPIPVVVHNNCAVTMKAYHLAQDHPFMAVTDANGDFQIHGLPPGEHTFTVWHELRGYVQKHLKITATAGKVTELDLLYAPEESKPR